MDVSKLTVNFAYHPLRRHRRRMLRWVIVAIVLSLGAVAVFGVVLHRSFVRSLPSGLDVPLQNVLNLKESTLLPKVLGFGQPFTVLLLFQNSSELRPTGGFIGTVGIVELFNAKVKRFWTDDVYRLDGYALRRGKLETPPGPLARYLRVHDWGIRDANWDPDFPTAARLVVDRFLARQPSLEARRAVSRVDAVIGVTPLLIARVLGVLGAVELEGRTFTEENFISELQEFVELGYKESGIAPWQRKDIIGAMARELLRRLFHDPTRVGQLLPVLSESIRTKDIQLFAFDEGLASWITRQGAAGTLSTPEEGDVLGIIDANLASFKTDAVIKRAIHYRLRERRATVTLTYRHTGGFDWKTTRYRTYTRVYVPLGSRLIEVRGALKDDKTRNLRRETGVTDISEEHGFTVFGAFTAIEPGTTGTLEFTYELPATISARFPYTLQLIKQAGTGPVPLTLTVEFGKTRRRLEPLFDRDTRIGIE